MTDYVSVLREKAAKASAPYAPCVSVEGAFLTEVANHIESIERANAAFDLERHLFEPSRVNPMAAAAAVNMRRSVL